MHGPEILPTLFFTLLVHSALPYSPASPEFVTHISQRTPTCTNLATFRRRENSFTDSNLFGTETFLCSIGENVFEGKRKDVV